VWTVLSLSGHLKAAHFSHGLGKVLNLSVSNICILFHAQDDSMGVMLTKLRGLPSSILPAYNLGFLGNHLINLTTCGKIQIMLISEQSIFLQHTLTMPKKVAGNSDRLHQFVFEHG
jgi:hypothetical protein